MREILLNICLTAIALCLFKMLLPENTLKKQADFLIACFFLASLTLFFTSGRVNFANGLEFSEENIPYIDFEEEYANAQKRAIEREMKARIQRVLAAESLLAEEIYVFVNISDKFSISITEVRLVFLGDGAVPHNDEGEQEDEIDEINETNDEINPALETLKQAIHIVQKEVGDSVLVTGMLTDLQEGRNA
jgi:hypothetical protein